MVIVPARATPNQAMQVVIDDQNCSLRIFTRHTVDTGNVLYMDLDVNGVQVCSGEFCQDGVPLPRYDYQGLEGKFLFVDMQGNEDPVYASLGSRWVLVYLTVQEAALYADGVLDFSELEDA